MEQIMKNKPLEYNAKGIMSWLTSILEDEVTNEQLNEILDKYKKIEASILSNCHEQLRQQDLQNRSRMM